MIELAVIVPSRGRPENVDRLLATWRTTTTAETQLLLVIDKDDPRRDEYWQLGESHPDTNWHIVTRPIRTPIGPLLNWISEEIADDVPVIGFMGDDHLPRTEGWDAAMVYALEDLSSGIVYGNDLLQGERLPTAAFMTSDIIRTLGVMCPPTLEHLYIDNYWLELGQAMGRLRYVPDVVIEHLHPAAGKASSDQTYVEANAPDRDRRDKAAFEAWRRDGLARDLELLRAAGVC